MAVAMPSFGKSAELEGENSREVYGSEVSSGIVGLTEEKVTRGWIKIKK
jgi:hypothetical protein